MKNLSFKKILITAAVVAALLTPSVPTIASPPPEFEQEVVQSLLLYDNPSSIPGFLHNAPASSCIAQGRPAYGHSCPDVVWVCPGGISAGALTRYRFQMTYDQLIAGFQSIDSMCVEGPIIPNPQLPTSVPAIPVPAIPVPVFTG